MKILEAGRDPKEEILKALCPSASAAEKDVQQVVASIIADIRIRGDEAVIDYGRRFDYSGLDRLDVTEDEFAAAYDQTSPELVGAIRKAVENVRAFHEKQLRSSWLDMTEGSATGQIIRPLERVGVYAPAGLAPLPSSVIMTALPAKVAGVPEVILCTPPQKDSGSVNPTMLVAARECGVDKVFKAGGAQAIAAMALGTATIPKVDKVAGPGNPFVVEAKRQVYGLVGIDSLAGPSEVVVLTDRSASSKWVASDLLAQAEHAPDARSILITTDRAFADSVISELKRMRELTPRSSVVKESLSEFAAIIIARDMSEAVDLVNESAPEHLEIVVEDPWAVLPKIKNAGAIMLGSYTPVALGDYAAGPSHTLPTAGTARFSSPLGVDDFIKRSSVIWYSREALRDIAETVVRIAEAEGLQAHADSVKVRQEDI